MSPASARAESALCSASQRSAVRVVAWVRSASSAAVLAGHKLFAARMAAAGTISHANGVSVDFGCGLGSSQTGENVGYWSAGINDAQLNTMFMNSAEHRANIMGPYRYVGTSWVVGRNGAGYIAVEFG